MFWNARPSLRLTPGIRPVAVVLRRPALTRDHRFITVGAPMPAFRLDPVAVRLVGVLAPVLERAPVVLGARVLVEIPVGRSATAGPRARGPLVPALRLPFSIPVALRRPGAVGLRFRLPLPVGVAVAVAVAIAVHRTVPLTLGRPVPIHGALALGALALGAHPVGRSRS